MVACSSCGRENPDGFAFCGYCSAPLAEAPPSPLEERKIVSIVFCDLVGFTSSSERQDPEDVRARLRPYHARLREEIERFGGTVEKFVGDAVMAAFGAPVAHEDDAERAVRAGLGILEAIQSLNASEPGLDLRVRVGINTGEAVVAVGAQPERGESLVAGDVVNTASRIQGAAPVNGVAVAESTYRTTSHIFEYEPLGPVSVKGKAEPLSLWRARAVRIRFGTDFHEHSTPFVGRELEKPLLIGIFERAMQRRTAQLVTVVGEPGVGKSRLVAELFGYMDDKPELVRWRHGRCLPYGEGITFWALGEIVKREAAILESDSSEIALQKLDAALSPEEPERKWLIQRLASLVGIETDSPAERQESFTAWRRYLEGLAAARQTVLVFEDLHWADEALLAFLEHLAEWSDDVPLLVLCTARPELYESRPEWGAGQRNAHTINLSPLSDDETAQLVSSLLAAGVPTPELEQAILERAGGNPLYAEELVRLVSDRDLTPDRLALPETVQALIAARLDTLRPERKSLLHDAAVIGKVFWASALGEMSGLDARSVELALHDLARKELVRPARASSMEGEDEYSFWHLLVRDVAYAQIPRADRARRHRSAAAWIERKAGERVEDLAEVLAHHYLQALDLAGAAGDRTSAEEMAAPARRFLALAGERALGLDTAQAEARLARALTLAPADDPERPELLVRWAEAAFQAGHLREATEALDEALAVLRAGANPHLTARALRLRSLAAIRLGEGRQVALATEAVALLESEPPGPELVAAYSQLANVHALAGAYLESIEAAEQALSLAARLGLDEPARALGYAGFARAFLGEVAGIAQMERALELLVARGGGRDAAAVQNNLALARYPIQGAAASLAAFEDAIASCEERGLRETASALLANVPGLVLELGRPEEALARAARLADVAEAAGQTHSLAELRAVEMTIRIARGEDMAATEGAWLVETGRAIATADVAGITLGAAANALVASAPDRARALLEEVRDIDGIHETTYYVRQLPTLVRTALAAGDRALASALVDRLPRRYALDELAACGANAHVAEDAGDAAEAVILYAEAARRWHEFGNVPERAYALLGEGRCLRTLRRPGAEEPLLEARDLFTAMEFEPSRIEAETLLRQPLAGAGVATPGD